ncbi:MAG TPA: hypothetical protein VGL77_02685 [Armatimonadota bacterium]|jgi:hypothetical protein
MQITCDEEMCALLTAVKWIDWHETFTCAIRQDAPDGKSQSVLVVTGSLNKRLQQEAHLQWETWTVADLFTVLLTSLAQGFRVDATSNRYILAMLEAIRKHGEDKNNVTWTTWMVV